MITIEQKIECLKRWREIFPRLRGNVYAKSMMTEQFGEEANEIACFNAIIADYEAALGAEIIDAERPYPPWARI